VALLLETTRRNELRKWAFIRPMHMKENKHYESLTERTVLLALRDVRRKRYFTSALDLWHSKWRPTTAEVVWFGDINVARQTSCFLAFIREEELTEQLHSRLWKCPLTSRWRVPCDFTKCFWVSVGRSLLDTAFHFLQDAWASLTIFFRDTHRKSLAQ
jgi:hypothetical protein